MTCRFLVKRVGPSFRHIILASIISLLVAGPSWPARAQSVTAEAGSPIGACDVEPRSIGDMIGLLGSTATGDGVPLTPKALTPGEPADRTTAEAITAAVRELEACLNAGDELRVLSLYSDNFFRQMPNTAETVAALTGLATATPMPAPEDRQQRLVGPWHLRRLADDRAVAAVLFTFEGDLRPDPIRSEAMFFVREDGRWLIDELTELVLVEECGGLTRVAGIVGPPPAQQFDAWPEPCDDGKQRRQRPRDRQATPEATE